MATLNGHVAVLDWLWARGVTLDDCRARNNEALRCAAANGHVAVLDWLLARGITLEDCRASGNSAVYYGACGKNRVAVLNWFLARGTTLEDYGGINLCTADNTVLEWLFARGVTLAKFESAGKGHLWRCFYQERALALIAGGQGLKPRLPAELWEVIGRWE